MNTLNKQPRPMTEDTGKALTGVRRLSGQSLQSSYRPADEYTQTFCVVLVPAMRVGEWVTRLMNGGKELEQYWGHYFDNHTDALLDYVARCKKYGVTP